MSTLDLRNEAVSVYTALITRTKLDRAGGRPALPPERRQ
jgi:hypothetical protein